MGKYFALSMQLPQQQTSRKRTNTGNSKAVERVGFGVLAVCLLLTVMNLVQVNSFATKGYEISKLQKEIDALSQERTQMEVEAAQLQSLQRLQGESATSSMTSVDVITYIPNTALSHR